MLKTRAYLCQTVIEASPMSRLASTLVGQARQALEGLFRRGELPKVPQGIVTRSEAPALIVGRQGLVASINRSSRSFVAQFLAKNRPADLAAAMRKRYATRRLGQAFGFVGVGVAAGSQWAGSDVDGDFHFEPFFKNVQEMFGGSKAKVDDSFAMLTHFKRNLNELTRIESDSSSELSFGQIEYSSISSEMVSDAVLDDISMPSDAVIELTNQKSDDDEAAENVVRMSHSIEELQGQLGAELLFVQTTIDTQRKEMDELYVIVSQLSVALNELTGNATSLDDLLEDFVVLEDEDVEDGLNDDDGERVLKRAWSLVSSQSRQLDILHRTVCDQNEQLSSLLSPAHGGPRTVITRSAHCKRDACCGPGRAG